MAEPPIMDPERVARRFHEVYELLAPDHGYETRPESAVPWSEVPAQNRELMIHVAAFLLRERTIAVGPSMPDRPESRSALRMKSALAGSCVICGRDTPASSEEQ